MMTDPENADVAVVKGDGSGRVTIGESTYRVAAADVDAARRRAVDTIRQHAVTHAEDVTVLLEDPAGRWSVTCSSGGHLHATAAGPPPPPSVRSGDVPPPSRPAELLDDEGLPPGRALLVTGGPSRRQVVLGAAGAVAVVAAGSGLVALTREDPPPRLPAGPPPGWTRNAAWSSPDLSGTSPAVLLSGSRVLTTVADDDGPAVVSLAAGSGEEQWRSPLEEGMSAPRVCTYGDGQGLVAAGRGRVRVWPSAASDESRSWSYTEAGVELVEGSPRPLLANEETLTAVVTGEQGQMLRRTLPRKGARPMAATASGEVVAVADSGHWWLLSDAESTPDEQLLKPPGFGALVREILGMAGETLVVSWTRGRSGTTVVGYDTSTKMTPQWSVRVPDRPDDLIVAPGGSWLITGHTAIVTSSGRSSRLPEGWRTLGMTTPFAWSSSSVVSRGGRVREVGRTVRQEQLPVDVDRDGRAYFVMPEGGKARLYAVDKA